MGLRVAFAEPRLPEMVTKSVYTAHRGIHKLRLTPPQDSRSSSCVGKTIGWVISHFKIWIFTICRLEAPASAPRRDVTEIAMPFVMELNLTEISCHRDGACCRYGFSDGAKCGVPREREGTTVRALARAFSNLHRTRHLSFVCTLHHVSRARLLRASTSCVSRSSIVTVLHSAAPVRA